MVDVMHSFLQNTTRRFLYTLQDSAARSPGRIVHARFQEMDQLWLTFKYPIEFARPNTQSLAKKKDKTCLDKAIQGPGLNTWKATQLRAWALYGSCLVLKGFADRKTTNLWRHLVAAMRILCDKEMCCDPDSNVMASDFIKSFQQKLAKHFPR